MALPPQYSEDFGGGFTGTVSAGNIQVHTREDSGNSIEEMFRVVTDPASSISSARPMKDRNLPPSFFEPSPQPLGLGHLAPTIKVGSASKSPSIASSMSPNLDHLYPEPDSVYAPASKGSGSDLALNETFNKTNFFDSAHPKVEYGHFRGGGGVSISHHRQAPTFGLLGAKEPQLHSHHLAPPSQDPQGVSHTRAHSSPAKMSSQFPHHHHHHQGSSKKAGAYGPQQQQPSFTAHQGLAYQQQQQQQLLYQTQLAGSLMPPGGLEASAAGSSHPNLSSSNFYRPPAATDGASGSATKEFPTQQQIDACDLPPGWEMAYSEDSKIYFVDHNSKITSWLDPRLPAELQSGWGHTAREIALLHQMKCARCNAYRKLSSLTAQKELLRRELEATTRNEFLMRQEVFTMQGGMVTAQQQQQQQPSVEHRRQESSDSGLACEPTVVTPPQVEINGASFSQMDTADTSVDCLLSSLKDSDLLLADFEMQTFRQDFQESI